MKLLDGESIWDYVKRLELRVAELEPPEGFTIQEWHIGQVYAYLLWRDKDDEVMTEWNDRLNMYENRFPEACKKFGKYMGWDKDEQS